MKTRATALMAATVITTLSVSPAAAEPPDGPPGHSPQAQFTLQADVLDGGEQVTSVTIDGHRLRPLDEESLTTSTFTVHAEARYPDDVDLMGEEQTVYAEERAVTDAQLTPSGDIQLDLETAFDLPGGATLGYLDPAGRNITLDLDYTVEQEEPLRLRTGREVTFSALEQGELVSPEVDAFDTGVSSTGVNYRLSRPAPGRDQKPLIVWLHGNGEGGHGGFYDNEPQLRANRGAVGPATPEAQEIFDGAYVLAPQVPDTWYETPSADYAQQLRDLIDEVAGRERIDTDRIHVMGASAGGYMATVLISAFPDDFASAVITCPAYTTTGAEDRRVDEEDISRLADTPTWFINSTDDPVVPAEETSMWAHDLLPDSILSLYDEVSFRGVDYPGHFSWIYTAQNDPTYDGVSLWEWMADQSR
ncbi:prolyl oligopeptidase family serine peptidase [Nesterenkonia sp. CL21]|uniref:prolyl oligopeptidase family serine peptidase n=1 Tax=Nesterenkonia sp. CL21 TaxID=3064894 RepID=UPI00287AF4EC|nr:prolyl oligopeptidase family serine peptidase [Nesterenkonia sp. CL21]MDS2172637.1 prolyl oligopeptidase family serine peptidase [Nesterenkonia sp. CL21]